jgi:hypothetical protein
LKKRTKKLFPRALRGVELKLQRRRHPNVGMPAALERSHRPPPKLQRIKVFCFFFAKKKSFLLLPLPLPLPLP